MQQRRFFSWRQAFMEDESLSGPQKLLLHTLASHMSAAGDSCYPSVQRLASEASMARETVIRKLKELREIGWIKVDLHGFSKQQWRRHEYSIGWPSKGGDSESPRLEKGGDRESPRINAKVVTEDHKGGDPQCVKVVTEDHLSTPENYPENKPEGGCAQARPPAREGRNGKTATAKKSTGKGKRLVPADWQPDQKLVAWCESEFPSVDWRDEAGRFVDHHRGHGNRFRDFAAAFRNWIRNADKFQQRDQAQACRAAGMPKDEREWINLGEREGLPPRPGESQRQYEQRLRDRLFGT